MIEPGKTELPPEHLPLVGDVVAVLKMCVDHDLPLEKLPKLWDDYQQLQQIERRAGIQNGNMDREIKRLRGLTAEQDKQLKDERLHVQELQARITELERKPSPVAYHVEMYTTRIKDLEETESRLEAQVRTMEAHQRDQDDALQEQADRYAALLARCKHFEALADHRRLEDLEDLIAHYRCGMEGMKVLADLGHFSNEFRLCLIRKTLYTFEPTVKAHQENATDA
ncbi:hypothetical protein D7B12_18075 [Salmonella enterica]|nr:hypothetical protein [Salmonella enterica]